MSHRNSNSISRDVTQMSERSHIFPYVHLPSSTDPPSSQNPAKQQTWLVYGASGHVGRSVVNAVLSHGDNVCAIGNQLRDTLASLRNLFPSNTSKYHGLLCDVRLRNSVEATFNAALNHFHEIDVIAVCTGYGVVGSCEDQDDYDIRNQFEVNFMGTLNIIQSSLAYFREREAGRYIICSSTSGALGVPGHGPYCATKYAVEGLVESMLYEVDQFNIKLTLVISGHLRRDETRQLSALDSSQQASNGDKAAVDPTANKAYNHFRILRPSSHYAAPDSPASHAQRIIQWFGNSQPTSTLKAAELIWQLGHCSYPPLRFLIGSFAVESIRDRLKSIIEEIEDWKELHFPPVEGMDGSDEMGHKEGDDEHDEDDGEQE